MPWAPGTSRETHSGVPAASGGTTKVVRVDDTYVDIEIAPTVKVKAVKGTLSDVVDPMTAKPAND